MQKKTKFKRTTIQGVLNGFFRCKDERCDVTETMCNNIQGWPEMGTGAA